MKHRMVPSNEIEWFQTTSINRKQCEEYNGTWVEGYRKRNGIVVRSFCRKNIRK